MFRLKVISHHQVKIQEYKWGYTVQLYFTFETSVLTSYIIRTT